MKLTDILFNRYYTPYKRPILIVFSIISFLTITIYSYQTYIKPSIKEKDSKNISNANRRTKEADMIFFHTSWCPHCKKALPIWKDFVSTYDQTIINGYTINCINGAAGIDCDDPKSTEIIEKYNITKFPTLKLIKDDITINFDANITSENMTKFVNTVL